MWEINYACENLKSANFVMRDSVLTISNVFLQLAIVVQDLDVIV